MEKEIVFCGQTVKVACDEKCNKAWGINSRPSIQLSNDVDDNCYLSDNELGEAPADPGTYEGDCAKPDCREAMMNKWCVRECERCRMVDLGEKIELRDFSKRVYNQPWKHNQE